MRCCIRETWRCVSGPEALAWRKLGYQFRHIAANTNPELTGLSWFDRISDEEYNQLPTEMAEDPAEESAEADGKAVERHPDGQRLRQWLM